MIPVTAFHNGAATAIVKAYLILQSVAVTTMTTTTAATATITTYDFGSQSSVQIDNPLSIPKEMMTRAFSPPSSMTLVNPSFLGAGSGGAVFSYQRQSNPETTKHNNNVSEWNDNSVLVKFSWVQSAESVRNECKMLNIMEDRHVTGIERCIAMFPNRVDSNRVGIIMEPVMEEKDTVSNLQELSTDIARQQAVMNLMKTMAQMLVAKVITTDIQPLISKTTGKLLLIDMTEAKEIAVQNDNSLSDVDRALVIAFCTEIINLIPDSWLEVASQSFFAALEDTKTSMDKEFIEIVATTPIANDDLIEHLRKASEET